MFLHKIPHLIATALALTLAVPVASPADNRGPDLTWGSGPVRYRAHQLFDAGFTPTQEQEQVLTQLDQVTLHGLVIRDLRPSEVLAAIQIRIAATQFKIALTWDSAIDIPDARISFTGRDMSLVNALQYLRRIANVRYEIRAGELFAVRNIAAK